MPQMAEYMTRADARAGAPRAAGQGNILATIPMMTAVPMGPNGRKISVQYLLAGRFGQMVSKTRRIAKTMIHAASPRATVCQEAKTSKALSMTVELDN
jgi:hypothetical protein